MPLLDWLEVGNRHHAAPVPGFADDGTGLILLDLPDFDSTRAANREIVERMVGLVDVLVWVLDPQKYADAAVHNDFLTPLAAHGAVTLVVLNQVDRLPKHGRPARPGVTQRHPGRRRAGQGAGPWRLRPCWATGVDAVRAAIRQVAMQRQAHPSGSAADVTTAAARLAEASGVTARARRAGGQRHGARRPGWPRSWPWPPTSRWWSTPSSAPTGSSRPAARAGP